MQCPRARTFWGAKTTAATAATLSSPGCSKGSAECTLGPRHSSCLHQSTCHRIAASGAKRQSHCCRWCRCRRHLQAKRLCACLRLCRHWCRRRQHCRCCLICHHRCRRLGRTFLRRMLHRQQELCTVCPGHLQKAIDVNTNMWPSMDHGHEACAVLIGTPAAYSETLNTSCDTQWLLLHTQGWVQIRSRVSAALAGQHGRPARPQARHSVCEALIQPVASSSADGASQNAAA